jgi:two-component system, sensor histidine kinase and response regulator
MKNTRVLIVDDDRTLLQALSEALQLRMRALTVETCDSAREALEWLADREYDAIVADIKMPGMDGLELLERIRELSPDTPTLLITGHGEHDLAVQALRGGAHDYVQKPIDRDYLIRSLNHAIGRRRLSRKVARQRQSLERHAHSLERHSQKLENWLDDRTRELRELYQREALARAELERMSAELEAARLRRDELISMIAHDLSSPLTTLRGYAELLARPEVAPSVREHAQAVIQSETGRMARLVEDLVSDTETTTRRFTIRPHSCDLVELAQEQVELACARAQRRKIILDAPERLPLHCDRERVAQVFANLLNNALAHAPAGDIGMALRADDGAAHVIVRDHGPGIPPDHLHAIFEPGVRLQGRAARQAPSGAGLGLSIARDIVEAHGGRIWAESVPGQGATFHVLLPTAPGGERTPGSTPSQPQFCESRSR